MGIIRNLGKRDLCQEHWAGENNRMPSDRHMLSRSSWYNFGCLEGHRWWSRGGVDSPCEIQALGKRKSLVGFHFSVNPSSP